MGSQRNNNVFLIYLMVLRKYSYLRGSCWKCEWEWRRSHRRFLRRGTLESRNRYVKRRPNSFFFILYLVSGQYNYDSILQEQQCFKTVIKSNVFTTWKLSKNHRGVMVNNVPFTSTRGNKYLLSFTPFILFTSLLAPLLFICVVFFPGKSSWVRREFISGNKTSDFRRMRARAVSNGGLFIIFSTCVLDLYFFLSYLLPSRARRDKSRQRIYSVAEFGANSKCKKT